MGTTECLDCKKEISDLEENCPHCGALRKRFPSLKKMGSTPAVNTDKKVEAIAAKLDPASDIASQKAVVIPSREQLASATETPAPQAKPDTPTLKPMNSAAEPTPAPQMTPAPQITPEAPPKPSLKPMNSSSNAESTEVTPEPTEEKTSALKPLATDSPNTPEEPKSALKPLATSPQVTPEESPTPVSEEETGDQSHLEPPPPVQIAFAPEKPTTTSQAPTPDTTTKRPPVKVIAAVALILILGIGLSSLMSDKEETTETPPAPVIPEALADPAVTAEAPIIETPEPIEVKILPDLELGPLSKEVLDKLGFNQIPEELSDEQIFDLATTEATQEFSDTYKDQVIDQFNKENPLIKQGDEITYNRTGVSINGMFKGTSANRALIDYTSYDLEDLPLKLQIGLLPKVRSTHLNKHVHNNFTLPLESKTNDLIKQIREGNDFQLYVNELKKKGRHLAEPPFDRIYSKIKSLKGDEQKAHADALIQFYTDYQNFLENRKDQARKVIDFAYRFDSQILLKQLQKAISLKRSFKAEVSNNTANSLVTLKGDHSNAQGFFINYFGLKCIIANRHSFTENRSLQIFDSSDQIIHTKGYILGKTNSPSKNSDIIIFGLSPEDQEKYSFIPIGESIKTGTKIEILTKIQSNKQNYSILHAGSRTLSISPDFPVGSSGAPVIANGKALGLAAYIRPKLHSWSSSGINTSEPINYAVKIASMTLSDYELLNLRQYYQDLDLIEKVESANQNFIKATKRDYGMPADRLVSKNSQLASQLRIQSTKLSKTKVISHLAERAKRALSISNDITRTINQVINGSYGSRPFN